MGELTLEQARAAVGAALEKSKEIGVKMNIAIVDALYNIEHSNQGLITFPGGIPLKKAAGEIVGAIGVSGSTVENDHIVAEAGAAAIS